MDQLRPKMGNPLDFFAYLNFINIMSSVIVPDHRFFWDAKTFKIPTKVDADATDAVMGLNKNEQEPGGINKNNNVTDDQ